jgi:hypothetical protein
MATETKKKAEEHKGKIAYATIARFLGKPYGPNGEILTKEAIDAMIENGVVAPNPKANKYGDAQKFYEEAMSYVERVNAAMVESGLKQCLRVQVFTPKGK